MWGLGMRRNVIGDGLEASLLEKSQAESSSWLQSIYENRHLLAGIIGFEVTEELLSNFTDTPELALPLSGWVGMMSFVVAVVSGETYHAQSGDSEKKLSSELYVATQPFIRVFLPFLLVGLTVVPAVFEHTVDKDSDAQPFLPLMEDIAGVVAALIGLSSLVENTDAWIKERNHLLVTVSGFTLLGVVNAVFDILGKEQPIPEVAVLPASGVLAGIFAVTMTKFQASRSQSQEDQDGDSHRQVTGLEFEDDSDAQSCSNSV